MLPERNGSDGNFCRLQFLAENQNFWYAAPYAQSGVSALSNLGALSRRDPTPWRGAREFFLLKIPRNLLISIDSDERMAIITLTKVAQ
jgi:hypothetical protein